MKKAVSIAVVLAVALAVVMCVMPVWSQGRPGPGGPRGQGGPMPGPAMLIPPPPPAAAIDGIARALELTANEAAALKAVLTASDAAVQPLMKTAGESARALREAVFAADYDARAVEDLAVAAMDAEANVVAASIDVWAQIRSVLTADQFAKLQPKPGPGCPPPGGPPPPGSDTDGSAPPARRR